MALYNVVRNNPSTAQDLNQVVNVLNGTTTDTQVTVANRISAQLTGATATSALVGGSRYGPPFGAGTFAAGDMAIDTVYALPWVCYQASGGPYPQGAWQSVGTTSFAARWYQTYYQTLNTGFTPITLDTPSFDPQHMWDTSVWGYIIPYYGLWQFVGAVHRWWGAVGNYRIAAMIYQNGQEVARGFDGEVPDPYGGGNVETRMLCNQGDVIQLVAYTNAPAPGTSDVLLPARTYLAAHFVGAQEQ